MLYVHVSLNLQSSEKPKVWPYPMCSLGVRHTLLQNQVTLKTQRENNQLFVVN